MAMSVSLRSSLAAPLLLCPWPWRVEHGVEIRIRHDVDERALEHKRAAPYTTHIHAHIEVHEARKKEKPLERGVTAYNTVVEGH